MRKIIPQSAGLQRAAHHRDGFATNFTLLNRLPAQFLIKRLLVGRVEIQRGDLFPSAVGNALGDQFASHALAAVLWMGKDFPQPELALWLICQFVNDQAGGSEDLLLR